MASEKEKRKKKESGNQAKHWKAPFLVAAFFSEKPNAHSFPKIPVPNALCPFFFLRSSSTSNNVSAVGSNSPAKPEKNDKPVNFVPRRRASVSAETSSVTMGKVVEKTVYPESDEAKERIKVAMQKCILFDGKLHLSYFTLAPLSFFFFLFLVVGKWGIGRKFSCF